MAVRHELMRFTGLDTAQLLKDPGQQMGYGYVSGNPLGWNDLLGLVTKPAQGPITSGYGPRPRGEHNGIDMANPMGGTVIASDSGEVVRVRQGEDGKANSVTIQHPDYSAASYSHVTSDLKVGDQVDEGGEVGTTDTSGTSTGPHLHYEYYANGKVQDPTDRIDNADPYRDPASSMTAEKLDYLNRHVPC